MHTTNSPDRSTTSVSVPRTIGKKERSSKMILPHGFIGLRSSFARGIATFKRPSRLSEKAALEAQNSAGSSLTACTSHTRLSLDRYDSNSSNLEVPTQPRLPVEDDVCRSPASTASPGTLKRKKLRKRVTAKSIDVADLSSSGTEKLRDELKSSRRKSSKKSIAGGIQDDDDKPESIRKSKNATGSPKKRKSKKAQVEPRGNKVGIIDVDDVTLDEDIKSVTSSKVKKVKSKKKSEKDSSEKKKKTKRKSKDSSTSKRKQQQSSDDELTKRVEQVLHRSSNSLHSCGSFSLGESLRSELVDSSHISHSVRSESLHSEIESLRSDRSSYGRSRSAHTRSSLQSVPSHRRSSSLKPCLRKSSRTVVEDPCFPKLSSQDSSVFSTHDQVVLVAPDPPADKDEVKPASQSSSMKLDDFIKSQQPCFDPFDGLGDAKGTSDVRSTESFYDRYTVASTDASFDLEDIFLAAGTSSHSGTRSTTDSLDLELFDPPGKGSGHGSSSGRRSHSLSPGRLAGRKKAVRASIADWTAPVDASIHWSSCHERRSLDGMSLCSGMDNSYHGGMSIPTTKINKSSNSSSMSRGDLQKSSLSVGSLGLKSGSEHDASTVGDEDEFADDEVFDNDMFDSDIEEDCLSDDELKGEEEDEEDENRAGGSVSIKSGQRTTISRSMSDSSFESVPWSKEEQEAFEESERHGSDSDTEESTGCGADQLHQPVPEAPCPFEILQMTPRTKTKFMTKRKKAALAAAEGAPMM